MEPPVLGAHAFHPSCHILWLGMQIDKHSSYRSLREYPRKQATSVATILLLINIRGLGHWVILDALTLKAGAHVFMVNKHCGKEHIP